MHGFVIKMAHCILRKLCIFLHNICARLNISSLSEQDLSKICARICQLNQCARFAKLTKVHKSGQKKDLNFDF